MSSEKKSYDFAPRTLGAGLLHKKDLILAIILIAFGSFIYYHAGKFPPAPSILGDTINADVFPKMLVVLLFFLTVIIPFEFKIQPEKINKIDKDRGDETPMITWVTIIVLLAIVFLAEFLGSVLTMFVICFSIPILWGEKRYLAVAIYAILFPAFVFLLFNKVLGLYFNPGLLEIFTK
jgi:putative tricarboxylic transport membrane protein